MEEIEMLLTIIRNLVNNIYRLVVAILRNEGENTEGWPTELV